MCENKLRIFKHETATYDSVTSRAVCYRSELAVVKTFMPGLASQIPQLYIQTIKAKFFFR